MAALLLGLGGLAGLAPDLALRRRPASALALPSRVIRQRGQARPSPRRTQRPKGQPGQPGTGIGPGSDGSTPRRGLSRNRFSGEASEPSPCRPGQHSGHVAGRRTADQIACQASQASQALPGGAATTKTTASRGRVAGSASSISLPAKRGGAAGAAGTAAPRRTRGDRQSAAKPGA